MIKDSFIKDLLSISFYEGSSLKDIKLIEEILSFIKSELRSNKMKWLSALDEIRLELIEEVVKYRIENKDFVLKNFMEVISGGRYSDFVSEIEEAVSGLINEEYLSIKDRIVVAYSFYKVKKDISNIKNLIEKIENGSFNRKDELVNELKCFTNRLIDKISVSFNDDSNFSALSELNFMEKDYDNLWDEIISNIYRRGIIPTGYEFLEQNLMMGGFESKRLYLIAGTSGIGKSLFLINLLINAIKNNDDSNSSGKRSLYVYITGENLVDETFIRLYCCLFGVPSKDFFSDMKKIKNVGTEEDIKRFLSEKRRQVQEFLNEKNSNIIIKYFPAGMTSVFEVKSYLNEIRSLGDIKCLYVDYLDLFNYSNGYYKEHRFELANVTQELKNISIEFVIPVVTVTQLNRSGYTSENITPANISESIEKINKSDCVMFIQGFNSDSGKVVINNVVYRKIKVSILKQRNGNVGESSLFYYKLYRNDDIRKSCFNYRLYEITDTSSISRFSSYNSNGEDVDTLDPWSL